MIAIKFGESANFTKAYDSRVNEHIPYLSENLIIYEILINYEICNRKNN